MIYHVYLLRDPLTQEVRYVGATIDPVQRFRLHIGLQEWNAEKNTWIRTLLERDTEPTLELICLVQTEDEAHRVETAVIETYRRRGANLLNKNMGGPSTSGIPCSEETRRKISESVRKFWTPEARQAHGERITPTVIGIPKSEEHRAKLSESNIQAAALRVRDPNDRRRNLAT